MISNLETEGIDTKHLRLRPLNITDLETTHAYAGNLENALYMVYLPNETIEETAEFLNTVTEEWKKEKPGYYEFAIEFEKKHIGAISLYILNENEGELGWILHKDYWGKGFTTEAAVAVKTFAFKALGITSLVAHCDSRNSASEKVMQKLGMTLESDNGLRCNKNSDIPVRELRYSIKKKY